MQRAQRTMIFSACVIITLIIATGIFITMTAAKNTERAPEKATQITTDATSQNEITEKIYIIKEYHGNVAAYVKDADTPFKVTEKPISELPEIDQKKLRAGIEVAGEKQMKRMLDDFCS